jgi:Cys-tRNA(Pro)/Cys-tRNA(Cys) deacylase
MAKPNRGATAAVSALERARVSFTLHPYEHDQAATGFGEEAAEKLGVDPRRIFKTLVAELGGNLVVAVVPVAGSLDLKALAAAMGGKKAALAEPAAAIRATGYVLGGISPLGQRTRLPTVLDAHAYDFDTILVSAGRRGLQVELSPADLARLTAARVAPVAAAG